MNRIVFLVVMVIAILAVADAQTKPKPKSTPKPTTPTATTVGAEAPLPRGSDLKEGASQAEKAAKVFGEIMGTPDKGIPTDLLNKAECVAVFPGVVKAGFIVGGKAGRGVASCRTPSGWSAPAFLEIKGGSVGLQVGGSSTELVLLFMNTNGLKKLVNNKVELGADASVAAGPVGREAAASTDASMSAEILSYSRSKGLFAGISLKGSVVSAEKSDMEDTYGKGVTALQVLAASNSRAPGEVQVFANKLGEFSSRTAKA
ncbi:MAG TPA: lipid-binding SYLF domain-containing protein [Pyrinomonadaceae bacterium]|nr:lipid-binding SYLF domain-containing protein [Pyrinomonadaceae bacterium]